MRKNRKAVRVTLCLLLVGQICFIMYQLWNRHFPKLIDSAFIDLCKDFRAGRAWGSICRATCSGNWQLLDAQHTIKNGEQLHYIFKTGLPWAQTIQLRRLVRIPAVSKSYNAALSQANLLTRGIRGQVKKEEFYEWHETTQQSGDNFSASHTGQLFSQVEYLHFARNRDMEESLLQGTCGSFYAVLDLQDDKRLLGEVAVQTATRHELITSLLKILKPLDTEPKHLRVHCDLSGASFGRRRLVQPTDSISSSRLILHKAANAVHPLYMAINLGRTCRRDAQCDFHKCRGICDTVAQRCLLHTVTYNLQLLCDWLLQIGWTNDQMLLRCAQKDALRRDNFSLHEMRNYYENLIQELLSYIDVNESNALRLNKSKYLPLT